MSINNKDAIPMNRDCVQSFSDMRDPGLPKRNPGLELANAFSVMRVRSRIARRHYCSRRFPGFKKHGRRANAISSESASRTRLNGKRPVSLFV